jgi:hypothetical protein
MTQNPGFSIANWTAPIADAAAMTPKPAQASRDGHLLEIGRRACESKRFMHQIANPVTVAQKRPTPKRSAASHHQSAGVAVDANFS